MDGVLFIPMQKKPGKIGYYIPSKKKHSHVRKVKPRAKVIRLKIK